KHERPGLRLAVSPDLHVGYSKTQPANLAALAVHSLHPPLGGVFGWRGKPSALQRGLHAALAHHSRLWNSLYKFKPQHNKPDRPEKSYPPLPGSRMINSAPSPGVDCTSRRAPISSRYFLVIDRPRPLPLLPFVL